MPGASGTSERSGDPLPAASALGPVRLRVSDLARSRAFCERVLGMQPLASHAETLTLGDLAGTPLVQLRAVAGLSPVPREGLLGLYHHALLLPDRAHLGAFLRHLRESGVRHAASDHWFSEAIYLTDPDGLTVEVYADRPRSEWRWQGGDVLGAVEPLAECDVLAAGEGTPWQGLPAGTSVGHLHFFVGDLTQAERFYVDALGFEPSTRRFPGALFVSAGRYHHHVGLNVRAAGRPVSGDRDAGLDAWELRLPAETDRAQLLSRAEHAGWSADRAGDVPVLTDPWGLRVRVSVA